MELDSVKCAMYSTMYWTAQCLDSLHRVWRVRAAPGR